MNEARKFITEESVRSVTEPLGVEGYDGLLTVLRRAFLQAAVGKGKERHANSLPFEAQPMQMINRLLGSQDGHLYQAIKKIQESKRLPRDRAVAELLGAINYLAGAVIVLEEQQPDLVATVAANDNQPATCACGILPAGKCPHGASCND
jgi:hypothetical protein